MESRVSSMPQGESNSIAATATFSNTDEDFISDMPDDLLHCILSFLDMVYVPRTACLSKRWRYVWTSLPYLNFSEKQDEANKKTLYLNHDGFEDFVDNVLILRKDTKIKTLHLSCKYYTYRNRYLRRWINAAVCRNVEEVDLRFSAGYAKLDMSIISQLLTCRTLTTLKLGSICLTGLELPNSVAQPTIRSLYFISPDINREGIYHLFSRLPVLETLTCSHYIGFYHVSHLLKDTDVIVTYNRLPKECFEKKMLRSCRDHCRMDAYNIKGPTNYSNIDEPICSLSRCSNLKHIINSMVSTIEKYQGTPNVASLILSASSKLLKFLFDVPVSTNDLHITSYFSLRFLELDFKDIILSMMHFLKKCPSVETCVLDMTKHPLNDPLSQQQFTCKMLTTLKLGSNCIEHLKLPNSIVQPEIRSMHLIRAGISREEISSFFSILPVLETLVFSGGIAYSPTVCDHLKLKDIYTNITYKRFPKEYVEKKMLRSCQDHGKMAAHNIEGLTDDRAIYNPPCSLRSCLTAVNNINTMVDAIENFQGTSDAASLTLLISSNLLKFLFDVPVSVEDLHITSYFSLRFLEMDTESIVLSTMYLLKKCPNVETCVLDMTEHPLNDPLSEQAIDRLWCWTLKNRIKFLEIRGVAGYNYELKYLKFLEILLMNTDEIETITIFISKKKKQSRASRLRLVKFRKKLSTLLESWSYVQVMFF